MIKRIVTIWTIAFIGLSVHAQENNALYFMDWVPQSNYLNPAKQYPCNLYLGAPGISTLQLDIGNSALSYKDLFVYDSQADSLDLAFGSPDLREDFMKNFKKVNYFSSSAHIGLGSFGFRLKSLKDYFFTFDFGTRFEGTFSYSKDFSRFLFEQRFLPMEVTDDLELSGVTQDWSNTGFTMLAYNELALGVSKELTNQWTVGGKLKILGGKMHAQFRSDKFDITSSAEQLSFDVDQVVHVSMPGFVNVDSLVASQVDSNVAYEPNFDNLSASDLVNMGLGFSNFGLAADLGAVYTPNEFWEFSASVLDLGFINWSDNPYAATSSGTFDFFGAEVDSLDLIISSFDSATTQAVDSIKSLFDFEENSDPYVSALSAKVYLGARVYIHPQIALGLLSVSRFHQGRIRQSLSATANFYPGKPFSVVLGYNMANYTFDNLMVGMNFKPGPFNFYILLDKVPIVYSNDEAPIPISMQYANVRLGFNLVFGCGKKVKDFPMIY